MTAAITAMKPAAAIRAPVSSLNATAAAASRNTGPVTATTTAETTVTRLMPTVPTRVRNNTVCTKTEITHCSLRHSCRLYLGRALNTSHCILHFTLFMYVAVCSCKEAVTVMMGSPSFCSLCSACPCLPSDLSFTANPLCCCYGLDSNWVVAVALFRMCLVVR